MSCPCHTVWPKVPRILWSWALCRPGQGWEGCFSFLCVCVCVCVCVGGGPPCPTSDQLRWATPMRIMFTTQPTGPAAVAFRRDASKPWQGSSPACPLAVSFWVFVSFCFGLFHFGPCVSLFFFCFFVVFAGVSEIESR